MTNTQFSRSTGAVVSDETIASSLHNYSKTKETTSRPHSKKTKSIPRVTGQNLANKLVKTKQFCIDRRARRMKDCLICGSCENGKVQRVDGIDRMIDPTPLVTAPQTNTLPADLFEAESDVWPWRDLLPETQ